MNKMASVLLKNKVALMSQSKLACTLQAELIFLIEIQNLYLSIKVQYIIKNLRIYNQTGYKYLR